MVFLFFRSREFPALWLDRAALLRGDMSAVLNVLNQGLASPEHADFALATRRLQVIRLAESLRHCRRGKSYARRSDQRRERVQAVGPAN